MIFNQIYRILSYLCSALFFSIFGFACYEMIRRIEYRKISLFELLLAFAFLLAALIISIYSISTRKYGKELTKTDELLDFPSDAQIEQKKNKSILFYSLSSMNILIGLTVLFIFGYGMVLRFFNGRQLRHFDVIQLAVFIALLTFGSMQIIYSIRMIRFHLRLKSKQD